MPNKPRKPIADMIEELKSWLPNYDHGPKDYPTLLWRILASIPGGDQAEDMGYEAFALGWQEADQLGRVLAAIQDKRDVEDLIAGLVADEEEGESENEVDEARRRRHPKWNQQMIGNAHVSDGQEGYWAQFPRGTSAKKVLDEFLSTADYSASTGIFTVTATIDEETASVRVGPGGQVLNEARHSTTIREPFPSRAVPSVWGPGTWTPSEARRRRAPARSPVRPVSRPAPSRNAPHSSATPHDRRRPRRK